MFRRKNAIIRNKSIGNSGLQNLEIFTSNQLEKLEAVKDASFGYLWLSLVTFGYLWLPLVTFGYLWLPLVTFEYLWLPLVTFGNNNNLEDRQGRDKGKISFSRLYKKFRLS